ncbi:hypothetical protein A3Q56_06420 [Intoshia linei]|uniref:Uncharacterized protein n=1 Tax=Intoshia linei TaxID=1819745 RepID=A0A177AVH9_9BILA|nr:hypothetical protein A3Q56_06420 [Intoshia linei]
MSKSLKLFQSAKYRSYALHGTVYYRNGEPLKYLPSPHYQWSYYNITLSIDSVIKGLHRIFFQDLFDFNQFDKRYFEMVDACNRRDFKSHDSLNLEKIHYETEVLYNMVKLYKLSISTSKKRSFFNKKVRLVPRYKLSSFWKSIGDYSLSFRIKQIFNNWMTIQFHQYIWNENEIKKCPEILLINENTLKDRLNFMVDLLPPNTIYPPNKLLKSVGKLKKYFDSDRIEFYVHMTEFYQKQFISRKAILRLLSTHIQPKKKRYFFSTYFRIIYLLKRLHQIGFSFNINEDEELTHFLIVLTVYIFIYNQV